MWYGINVNRYQSRPPSLTDATSSHSAPVSDSVTFRTALTEGRKSRLCPPLNIFISPLLSSSLLAPSLAAIFPISPEGSSGVQLHLNRWGEERGKASPAAQLYQGSECDDAKRIGIESCEDFEGLRKGKRRWRSLAEQKRHSTERCSAKRHLPKTAGIYAKWSLEPVVTQLVWWVGIE